MKRYCELDVYGFERKGLNDPKPYQKVTWFSFGKILPGNPNVWKKEILFWDNSRITISHFVTRYLSKNLFVSTGRK